jgi:hypothetical protein
MEKTSGKTSTWLALRNHVFCRLWLPTVVYGSCIGAHNTAVYLALHKLGAKTVLVSLMATVSALSYTLFTLAADAFCRHGLNSNKGTKCDIEICDCESTERVLSGRIHQIRDKMT